MHGLTNHPLQCCIACVDVERMHSLLLVGAMCLVNDLCNVATQSWLRFFKITITATNVLCGLEWNLLNAFSTCCFRKQLFWSSNVSKPPSTNNSSCTSCNLDNVADQTVHARQPRYKSQWANETRSTWQTHLSKCSRIFKMRLRRWLSSGWALVSSRNQHIPPNTISVLKLYILQRWNWIRDSVSLGHTPQMRARRWLTLPTSARKTGSAMSEILITTVNYWSQFWAKLRRNSDSAVPSWCLWSIDLQVGNFCMPASQEDIQRVLQEQLVGLEMRGGIYAVISSTEDPDTNVSQIYTSIDVCPLIAFPETHRTLYM